MNVLASRSLFAFVICGVANCGPQDDDRAETKTEPDDPTSALSSGDEVPDLEASTQQNSAQDAPQQLEAEAAAELAARLANDRCEELYGQRPFKADQHPAKLKDEKYHWGGLDVSGPGGLSAYVTFRDDASDPQVKIYFSDDTLSLFPTL